MDLNLLAVIAIIEFCENDYIQMIKNDSLKNILSIWMQKALLFDIWMMAILI